jgi:mannan endo-1,4-beta-mannosidase
MFKLLAIFVFASMAHTYATPDAISTRVEPTAETLALLKNLMSIQSVGSMFGHHDGLMYGREWFDVSGRSDVHEICGDYPAVYSCDFAEIMDGRRRGSGAFDQAIIHRCILEAYAKGQVITACIHIDNPLTGGSSWDNTSDDVVRQILLEGSPTNIKYKVWLDRLADFAKSLIAPSGELIPILFRPYHEHTQEWNWWGRRCATDQQFIDLWRFTIDYLSNTHSVRNFLYAISPQMDYDYGLGTRDRLLYRWPGDDYVDFLGIDCYHGTQTAAFQKTLEALIEISYEKNIPVGVTEIGIEGIRAQGNDILDYWTAQILAPVEHLKRTKGKTVSMIVMWRNEYSRNPNNRHFYGPWIGHPSTPDFLKLYNSDFMIFNKELPNMYQ